MTRLLIVACALALVISRAAVAVDLPENVFAPGPATTGVMLPADVFQAVPGEDRIDVVLIGNNRVAVARMSLTVGDRPFRRVWSDFAVRLHRYLDQNDDGVLTIQEANRAPWTNVLQNPFNGRRSPFQLVAKAVALDASKDGKVTIEELLAYLRLMQDADALGVHPGAPPDDRVEALFGHLDADSDQSISRAEIAATTQLLDRLDQDENEVIDLDELTPESAVSARRFGVANDPSAKLDVEKSPVYVTTLDADRLKLARRIASAFRKSPGGRPAAIAPETLGLNAETARAFDLDHDGLLQAEEIAAYLRDPVPELELSGNLNAANMAAVRRGSSVSTSIDIVASKAKPRPGAPSAARKNNGASVVVSFQDAEIEWSMSGRSNVPGLQFFERRFNQADADKNGVIDQKEARGDFFLQQIHAVADRDGDRKMTHNELKAYAALNSEALQSRAAVSIADGGSLLHQRLDGNGDERLTLRELRLAESRLRDFDRNRDGSIQRDELPRRSLVTIGADNGRNAGRVVNVVRNRNVGGPAGESPVWFARMDRNRDGDVSPTEFLGPPEHFRRFDADRDGLIDATEAARLP